MVKQVVKLACTVLISVYLSANAFAQEEPEEQHHKVPYSLDSFVFVNTTRGPAPGESGRGYYEIIVSPLPTLMPHANSNYCELLLHDGKSSITDEWNQDPDRNSFEFKLNEKAGCTDLNRDNIPEMLLWGWSEGFWLQKKMPFILAHSSESDNAVPDKLIPAELSLNIPAHLVRQRPTSTDNWTDLVYLSFWSGNENLSVYPVRFDKALQSYAQSQFMYQENEILFSTANKKLAYEEFNTSFVQGNLFLNRVGSLVGYIHGEAQMSTGGIKRYIAALDLKTKRFRHLDVFNHPTFQKAVNQKYPGFLKKASESAESDPITLTAIGFNKRDLIFKAQVSVWGISQNTKFCGYWKYNVDSGQIALVSWNPSASINVEHKGYGAKINE